MTAKISSSLPYCKSRQHQHVQQIIRPSSASCDDNQRQHHLEKSTILWNKSKPSFKGKEAATQNSKPQLTGRKTNLDKFRYTIKKKPQKREKKHTDEFQKNWKSLCKNKFLRNSTTKQHITLTEQSTTTKSNTLQSSHTPLRALEKTRVLGREGRRAFLIHWMAYFPWEE
jgi:hypothetical protein